LGAKVNLVQWIRENFLDRFCPDPQLIQAAIDRLNLWDVREFGAGEFVCRTGERAEACWIIISGAAEVSNAGSNIVIRQPGEMIGEQAFLTTLLGKKKGRRTADIVALGTLKLMCFDASLQEKFTFEEQAAWGLTLAAVVNEKLEQATRHRVDFRRGIAERDALLSRFAEGDALGIVRKRMEHESAPVVSRDVIVWFSDIANFSTWAAETAPAEIARLVRVLTGCQIERIRKAEGHIDKLMGDGVMAVWFTDTAERKERLPAMAVECALQVVADVGELLHSEGLDTKMAVRIGMHSGIACFGDFGAEQRIAVTVLGHDVNLASRYEQATACGLGAVRVSESLKQLVEKCPSRRDWVFAAPIAATVKHGLQIDVYCPEEKGKSQ
jgi:class 3 adenylate cyclase